MIGRRLGDTWRRRAVLGLIGVWGIVSLSRLTRVVEPAEAPPGGDIGPTLDFFRANIPRDAGFLFVLPGEFGADTGTGPRLRFELYPRVYDDVRASRDETSIRQLMQAEALRFVVVPDASVYAPSSWLRQPRSWLRRIDFDANRYLLEVVA